MLDNAKTKLVNFANKEQKQEKVLEIATNGLSTLNERDKEFATFSIRKKILTAAPPKTAEEYLAAIEGIFGYRIPYTVCDESHTPPAYWMWKTFTGEWEKSLAWASREGAKTLCMSIQQWMLGTYFPGHDGLHAAGSLTQANVAQRYLEGFYRDPISEGSLVSTGVTANKAQWLNGSFWRIVAGTYKGVDGQHPNTLTVDEVKHWNIKAIEQTWDVPSPKRGLPKRLMFGSTNQDSGGAFNFILEESKKRQVHVAKWNCMDCMRPCKTCIAIDQHPHAGATEEGDKARESVCALWKYCRGTRAKKLTGWRSREEVANSVISKGGYDSDTAQTQQFCLRPSTNGLVVSNFLEADARTANGNLTNLGYTPDLDWFVGYDPSEGSRSICWFIQYYPGGGEYPDPKLWIFDQLCLDDCPDATYAKVEFYNKCKQKGYKDPKVVVVDPRKTDAVYQWRLGTERGEGLYHKYDAVTPSIVGADGGAEITNGIAELCRAVCDGRGYRTLLVNKENAPDFVKAVLNHGYKTTQNGSVKSGVPSEIYKDEIDAIRYFIRYYNTEIRPGQYSDSSEVLW